MRLFIPLRTELQEQILIQVEEILKTIGIEFDSYTQVGCGRIWDFSQVQGAWIDKDGEKVSLQEDLGRG